MKATFIMWHVEVPAPPSPFLSDEAAMFFRPLGLPASDTFTYWDLMLNSESHIDRKDDTT